MRLQLFFDQRAKPFFFLDKESCGRDAVVQGKATNGKLGSIQEQGFSFGLRWNKGKRVAQSGIAPAEVGGDDFVQASGPKYRQGLTAFGEVVTGE
jgi:hypothetical protein